MRTVAVLGLLSWNLACPCLLLSRCANAAPASVCPDTNASWVRVTVDAPEDPRLAYKLLEHLQAELAPHHIGVCTGAGTTAPLAEIHIVHPSSNLVAIEVEVEDSVTQKRVVRDLNLRGLPEDAHALTIALSAAELLRASWAEIKLRQANAPSQPVPEGVANAVDEKLAESPARAALGLRAAGEEFSRGLRQAGVDATAAFPIIEAWQLCFRLGVRQAAPTPADDGSIRANAWLIGTGASFRLTPPEARAFVGLMGRLDWVRMQFFGEPQPGAFALSGSGSGFLASGGVLGAIRVSRFAQFEAELDAGDVAKGVSARDANRVVVAMNGPWVGAGLGLTVRIW